MDKNGCAEERWDEYLELVADAELFHKIYKSKKCFILLFTELANRLMVENLDKWHPSSKGIKVSQGNSLQNCPYQVLDIIRDFNPEVGLNIRLLNWWGRGIYIFFFLGGDTARRFFVESTPRLPIHLVNHDFYVSLAESPWDYKEMVDKKVAVKAQTNLEWRNIIEKGNHIQVFKKLSFENTPLKTQTVLFEEIMLLGKILKGPH
jgi:hypothetical protein